MKKFTTSFAIALFSLAACNPGELNNETEVSSRANVLSNGIEIIASKFKSSSADALFAIQKSPIFSGAGIIGEDAKRFKALMKRRASLVAGALTDSDFSKGQIKKIELNTQNFVDYHHAGHDADLGILLDTVSGNVVKKGVVMSADNAKKFKYLVTANPVPLYSVVQKSEGVTKINMRKLLRLWKRTDTGQQIFTADYMKKAFPEYVDDLRVYISKLDKSIKEFEKATKALKEYDDLIAEFGSEAWRKLPLEIGYVDTQTELGTVLFLSVPVHKTPKAAKLGFRNQHPQAAQAACPSCSVDTLKANMAGEMYIDVPVGSHTKKVDGNNVMTIDNAIAMFHPEPGNRVGPLRTITGVNNKSGHLPINWETVSINGRQFKSNAGAFNCSRYEAHVGQLLMLGIQAPLIMFDQGTNRSYEVTFENCHLLTDKLTQALHFLN